MRSIRGDARAGSVLADNQVSFPVSRDFPISDVGAIQSIASQQWVVCARPLGVSCVSTCARKRCADPAGSAPLGQTRLQPSHDHRATQGTKQPPTPHDQPPNSHTATQNCLHPNDTAPYDTDLPAFACTQEMTRLKGRHDAM